MDLDRRERLLSGIDKSMKILEIGPGYNPAVRKADGWNVWTIDHATRAGLLEKYAKDDIPYDLEKMEEIDFIFSDRSLPEAIPAEHHGTFDAVIASHVIEHYPDVVSFFQAASAVLKPDGLLSLAIPDKRYTFDAFRPVATTGDALEAHHQVRLRHSKKTAFDNIAYFVSSSYGITWGEPFRPTSLQLQQPLTLAKQTFDAHHDDVASPYQDYHCWIFTPASFQLMVIELAYLELIDFRIAQRHPTVGCEFLCSLRRGREMVADTAAFEHQRLQLMMEVILDLRAQADYVRPLLDGKEGQPTGMSLQNQVGLTERLNGLEFQMAVVTQQLARQAEPLRRIDRAIAWPRRASRKVRKKLRRWLHLEERRAPLPKQQKETPRV